MRITTVRRTNDKDAPPLEEPRSLVFPPELVDIIMEMVGTDRETLSACTLVSREFTFAALCRLGRHITINTASRVRECASLLASPSAFQHVRSLDLGITKRVFHRRDWDDYLAILDVFASRRTLTRLWFSEVPFYLSKRGQERARTIIISLATTVNELGLYSCNFLSYADMISLIRSFTHCTSLYVRDCFSRKTPGSNMFADLPLSILRVNDLELSSSSDHRFLTDVSTLIEDAALDVSSLTDLLCDMSTADQVRRTLMITAASPIESLQVSCEEADGFHVLADQVITSWPLRSLIIGPVVHKDGSWCERASSLNPNLPYLESVTVLGSYNGTIRHCRRFWEGMDQILSRENMFPRLKCLDICITVESIRLQGNWDSLRGLSTLRRAGKLYFWGKYTGF